MYNYKDLLSRQITTSYFAYSQSPPSGHHKSQQAILGKVCNEYSRVRANPYSYSYSFLTANNHEYSRIFKYSVFASIRAQNEYEYS
jgi:hypothetical protein